VPENSTKPVFSSEACWPHQVREEGNQGSGQRDPMQRVLKEAKEHTMSKQAEWRRRPAAMPSASSVASERALLDAAEEVVTRWAVYRVSEGELGSCGLPEALQALSRAWEAYEPEEE